MLKSLLVLLTAEYLIEGTIFFFVPRYLMDINYFSYCVAEISVLCTISFPGYDMIYLSTAIG